MPETKPQPPPTVCPECLAKGKQSRLRVWKTRAYQGVVTRERRCTDPECDYVKHTNER